MIANSLVTSAFPFIEDEILLAKKRGKKGTSLYSNTFMMGNLCLINCGLAHYVKLSGVAELIKKEGFAVKYKKTKSKETGSVKSKTLYVSWGVNA